MIDPITSIEQARAYRYGVWSGQPRGQAFDPARCCEETSKRGSYTLHQCSRKPGKGPSDLYCTIHARQFNPTTQA